MKILHVDTGKEWRGGQKQALLLHKGLIEAGFESYLAANSIGKLIEQSDKNIIPYIYKGEITPISVMQLLHIINKVKPDIVHSHDAHSLTPAIFANYLNKNFILIHTKRVDFSIRKNFFSKFKYCNSRLKRIVAISKAIKMILIDDGISKNKIDIIYSGVELVNPDMYSCPEETIKKYSLDGYTVLGCVANFADHKDHKTLLKAFDKIWQHHKNLKLLLVGDGPLFKEISDFAKKLKSYPNIIFTGFKNEVFSILKCIDIFVITSKEEGLCTSIIDALNFGIPVVATKAGGIPEVVKDGYNGLLCEIKNHEDIASKISLFLENNELYEKIKSNTRKSVLKFDYKNMVDDYIKLYKKLLTS